LLALWPVLDWILYRFADRSDDPLGLIALLTFLAIQVFRKCGSIETPRSVALVGQVARAKKSWFNDARSVEFSERLLVVLLSAYAVSLGVAPKAIQALFGLTIIGFTFSSIGGFNLLFADWCLLYLTLPIVSSLNFFLGYPLRLFITECAAVCLRFDGFHAVATGVLLQWNSHALEVDPPCSGVKMLWFAIFLAASLASLFGLNVSCAMLLVCIASVGAIAANVLRVTSIFFLETDVVAMPRLIAALSHDGLGAGIYLLLATGILVCALRLARRAKDSQHLQPNLKNLIGAKLITERDQSCSKSPRAHEEGQLDSPLRENRIVTETEERERANPEGLMGTNQDQRNGTNPKRYGIGLVVVALVVAILPFLKSPSPKAAVADNFCGWPREFEGKPLRQMEDSAALLEFSRGFPGKVGLFSDGENVVWLRWITSETRQVHPSSDCYRGLGYEISYRPSITDRSGNRWNTFEAYKNGRHVFVRERIFDSSGQSWDDVSAWYWSAVFGKTRPVWWSVTVSGHEDAIGG
jgi:exosortase/archaeosortase family protein